MTNLDKILAILKQWVVEKKVGSVTINFFKGGITTINLNETVKITDK